MASLFPQFGNVFGGANASGRVSGWFCLLGAVPPTDAAYFSGPLAQNELVSFNAGKMTVKPAANGKFLISPDLKKGKVCLSRGDDQLLHFQWIDRQTGASPEVRGSP